MNTKKDLLIPQFTANDESVKITSWLVEDKDYIECGQKILLVETSKVSVEIESELTGYISKNCQLNDIVAVGKCYAYLFNSLTDLEKYQPVSEANNYNIVQDIIDNNTPTFSNAALKFIHENQLNPKDFTGLGLVTIEKIKEKLEKKNSTASLINKEYFPQSSAEALSFSKIAEINNLKKANDAIMSSLSIQFNSEHIRTKMASIPWLNRRLLSYILHVFAKLLSQNPRFTSFYADGQICMYNRVNIGLAIDLGKGLKVAVINDVEQLSLFDLQMNIVEAIAHYHEDSLTLPMLQNSTVTVTDLSHDDILYFQPVLYPNHAMILGIGGDQKLPGAPITLTIAFDHRILSGQEVAIFLKTFKEKLLTEYHYIEE